jgi:ADP-ribose pyrophosphatase
MNVSPFAGGRPGVKCSTMSEFDSADCLRRYLARAREQPAQFENPRGDIYEILLEPARIERAQRDAETYRRREGLPAADTRVGILAEDPYLVVMRDAVRFADGSYGLYNRLIVPAGAAVLPMIGNTVVLLHRFRHGTRTWHLEIPRGAFSGTGTRADEARRELHEEIGATAEELIDLGTFHATTGCLDEEHQLYLARISAVGHPDRHEAIASLERLDVPAMETKIADGTITDGPTLAAFLRARLRGHL